MKKSLLLLSTLGFLSCQHNAIRYPSSVGEKTFADKALLTEAYNLNLEIDQLYDRQQLLERTFSSKSNQKPQYKGEVELKNVKKKILDKQAQLLNLNLQLDKVANDLKEDVPVNMSYDFNKNFRIQNEKLFVSNPENFKLVNGSIARTFSMDLNNTKFYQLGLVAWSMDPNLEKSYKARIICDADFEVKETFRHKVEKNTEYFFDFDVSDDDDAQVLFSFNHDVKKCNITFSEEDKPFKLYGLYLVNDATTENKINTLRNKVDVCLLPDNKGLTGVEKFFLNYNYQSMTCGIGIQDIKTLEIPIEGLKSKAEALLGQPLPNNILESKNPFLEMDFSKAPKLNTIFISYLVFRADFYGNLIARLVKWHADHGADVRILVSDVITLKKDQKMLYDLQESTNNIKIQEFRYDSESGMGLWDHISELHRTMHVKLLITLSDTPENNVVFFGGRNIHDGFVFKETPDHSKLPDLVQYGKGMDDSYAHWRDFEMRIRSKELAERVSSHLLTLWEKDSKTMFVRSINQNIRSDMPANKSYFENRSGPLVRHFMSIPYKDEHALEKFYSEMLDSAEKSIRISTPYFRPTKMIGDAMERAVKRGVDVSLITRIDLSGDTAAIILGEVNKTGINTFLNKIKIYEYTEPAVILHSKLVLIDGKYSFVGSVNLNKRSFIHDTENGIMVYDTGFNQKMNSIMDTYRLTSREVTERQKIALWKKVVIGLLDEEF